MAVCLTETWLKNSFESDCFSLQNYFEIETFRRKKAEVVLVFLYTKKRERKNFVSSIQTVCKLLVLRLKHAIKHTYLPVFFSAQCYKSRNLWKRSSYIDQWSIKPSTLHIVYGDLNVNSLKKSDRLFCSSESPLLLDTNAFKRQLLLPFFGVRPKKCCQNHCCQKLSQCFWKTFCIVIVDCIRLHPRGCCIQMLKCSAASCLKSILWSVLNKNSLSSSWIFYSASVPFCCFTVAIWSSFFCGHDCAMFALFMVITRQL